MPQGLSNTNMYRNLNSKGWNPLPTLKFDNPLQFDHLISETNTKATIQILRKKLNDRQSTTGCVRLFRNAVESCKWDRTLSRQFYTNLYAKTYIKSQGKRSTDTKLDGMIQIDHTKHHKRRYLLQLKNIQQKYYTLIRTYYEKISEIVRKTSFYNRTPSSEVDKLIEDSLIIGLCSSTQCHIIGLRRHQW